MKDSAFTMLNSYGGYFICATYENISTISAMDFSVLMTKKFGVTTIPVSAFYLHGNDDRVIRFCFAKKDETLIAAAEKLSAIKSIAS
jgi:methionine aminotransferase